ncbi:DUF4274 domain-containing protein [Sporosarcina sp. FSL K6-1522]|uniref:DUF4274 domain-containing protein n=1 Tax=Sporosarcina sp. FSL K6-1522 TaxID=2921554 RepID=UPI00315A460C
MISEQRENELASMMQWAICAGDDYYFEMAQDQFDKSMKGHEGEGFYHAYVRQRKVGFESFKNEIAEQMAAIDDAEELHSLLVDYNYDDGAWAIEQVLMHPHCDIATARMVYWLMEPSYYYEEFGGLEQTPEDSVNRTDAELLAKIEEKAGAGLFQSGLQVAEDEDFAPKRDDTPPYHQIPTVLWKPAS